MAKKTNPPDWRKKAREFAADKLGGYTPKKRIKTTVGRGTETPLPVKVGIARPEKSTKAVAKPFSVARKKPLKSVGYTDFKGYGR